MIHINMIGPFVVNAPFGTEIAFKKGFETLGVHVHTWDPNIPEQTPKRNLVDFAEATIVFKSMVGRESEFQGFDRNNVILYQPDDMRFEHVRKMAFEMKPFCAHFLSFDKSSAMMAMQMGYKNCREMLVTADPDVYYSNPIAKLKQDIDICMVASLGDPVAHASRRKLAQIALDYGKKHNLNVQIHDGIRDSEIIRQMYDRSKVVINHATDVGQEFGKGFGYQCRHFEVALTKTAFLTNTIIGEDYKPPFIMYYDEKSFLFWLETLLNEEEVRNNTVEMQTEAMQNKHMPWHRAQEMLAYIEEVCQ